MRDFYDDLEKAMKLVPLSGNTKSIELKVPADVRKAFRDYRKNLICLDYEKDTWTVETIMESWLCSFVESDEFKKMAELAEEKRADEKAEAEAKKAEKEAKKKAKDAERIAKLKAEISKLENVN